MKNAVIFDFDGVLVDSFDEVYKANALAMNAIGKELGRESYKNLFSGNIHLGLREFIGKEENYKKFIREKETLLPLYYGRASFFPFAKDLVVSLAKIANLGIVSSAPASLIEMILREQGLKNCFKIILGNRDENKIAMIDKAFPVLGQEARDTFFITDTIGDIMAAKERGCKTIAVSWGFQSAETLKGSRPDYLVHGPGDILSIINFST